MTVRFETRREDFPPNLTDLRIQHVTLYFVRRIGEPFEQDVSHLLFQSEGSEGGLGGTRRQRRRAHQHSGRQRRSLAPDDRTFPRWRMGTVVRRPAVGQTRARDRFAREEIENSRWSS